MTLDKKIDLHLVSWLRPKMTNLVIKTICRNTKRENYRLTVLDNGSDVFTRVMLNELNNAGYIDELVGFTKNTGLEAARNYMLYESTYGPYFVCVDNDCLPEPINEAGEDWLERLYKLMVEDLANENYAALACRTQVMVGTGNIYEEADKEGLPIVEFPHPGGSLRLMRTDPVRSIGGWKETKGRGQEERFICGKLHELGYKTGFATNIRTHHLFGIRGESGTDRWGYPKKWKPAMSGHTNVHHPALENGDDYEEVKKYCGEELAKEYFSA